MPAKRQPETFFYLRHPPNGNPMDILPDELCQDIFTRLAGFYQNFDFVHPRLPLLNEAICAPFRIAATCTRWRALVLSTPELWAFFHARDDRPEDELYLRICLERSGQHPLDVWIHSDIGGREYTEHDTDEDDDDAKQDVATTRDMFFRWLGLLMLNLTRWRRIRIDFPRPTPIGTFTVFTQPMPQLRQLVLSPPNESFGQRMVTDGESDVNEQQLYFQECPNLRSLTSHAAIMVPVGTLSKLEYLNFSLRGFRNDAPLWAALAMTPVLRELVIYYECWRPYNSEPPLAPRHLPTLRSLGLIGYYQHDQDIGRFITMPNLETLIVSVEPTDRLAATFTSIGAVVKHVVITAADNRGWFARSDAAALDSLQLVETLELRDILPNTDVGGMDDFFMSLAGIDDYSSDPMPKWGRTLKKIILRDCTIDFENCESLAALVNMRNMAARDDTGDAFELLLINTKFIQPTNGQVSQRLVSFIHLFSSFIVEVEPEGSMTLGSYLTKTNKAATPTKQSRTMSCSRTAPNCLWSFSKNCKTGFQSLG
ncbi:hypothetical protein BKA62DRAFT_419490 [Auriculariales sp. MPI-PUGE-AT-0066]|nr:hypothetical protein BKA62DRAFT_419490 [Auriculariales sp. MPI-PUGE-AT-0066]